MALFDRLLPERRAISPATLWGTGLEFNPRVEAGVTVNVDTALTASPIWAAQKLISDDVSNLPVGSFVKKPDGTREPFFRYAWLDLPDPFDPSITFGSHVQQVALSLLQDGNGFVWAEGGVHDPQRLEVFAPTTIEVRKPFRSPEYHVVGRRGRSEAMFTPLDMIHIAPFRKPGALRGLNPIKAAEQGIGLGIAAERYTARFFGSGALMPGFIKVPGEGDQKQLDDMADAIRKRHKGWRGGGALGFLTGGADWVASGINPKDADLSVIREYQVEEACRIYGIPPHKLGSQKPGAVGYASIEQRSIDYVQGLAHYIVPIENAYRRLTSGDTTYIKFNVAGLLRGDLVSRYGAYGVGLLNGFLSIDDVRRLEDLPPVKGGNVYRVQAQMTAIDAPPVVAAAPMRADPVNVNIAEATFHDDREIPAPVVNVPAMDTVPLAEAMMALSERLDQAMGEQREALKRISAPRRRKVIRGEKGEVIYLLDSVVVDAVPGAVG